MNDRIQSHPILPVEPREPVPFTWQDQSMEARAGETIAAALLAHGIHVFGHHPRDGSPQGLFCANGQCAQCLVMADGRPVKACMTPVTPHMHVTPLDGLPTLPASTAPPPTSEIEEVETRIHANARNVQRRQHHRENEQGGDDERNCGQGADAHFGPVTESGGSRQDRPAQLAPSSKRVMRRSISSPTSSLS